MGMPEVSGAPPFSGECNAHSSAPSSSSICSSAVFLDRGLFGMKIAAMIAIMPAIAIGRNSAAILSP